MSNANPSKQSIDKKWYENFISQISGKNSVQADGETIKEIVVSGISAVKATQPIPGLKRTDVAVFVPLNTDILNISYSLTSESSIGESVFDQILSTFKFTQ
jgi:hypothetical protein